MLLEVFPVGHYHGGIGSTSRTIPRQPVTGFLRCFWTGKRDAVFRGNLPIAGAIRAMVNPAPFVADNGEAGFISARRDAKSRRAL